MNTATNQATETHTVTLDNVKRNDTVKLVMAVQTGGQVKINHNVGDTYRVLGFFGSMVSLSRKGDHAKLMTPAAYLSF